MEGLTIIVPCHNEESYIQDFYESAVYTFSGSKYKVKLIFADDASTDQTREVIQNLHSLGGDIEVALLPFQKEIGKEMIIYEALKDTRDSYIAIMDICSRHSFNFIYSLLEPLRKDKSIKQAVAVRKNCQHITVRRTIGSFLFHTLMGEPLGTENFRVIRGEAVVYALTSCSYYVSLRQCFNSSEISTKYVKYDALDSCKKDCLKNKDKNAINSIIIRNSIFFRVLELTLVYLCWLLIHHSICYLGGCSIYNSAIYATIITLGLSIMYFRWKLSIINKNHKDVHF